MISNSLEVNLNIHFNFALTCKGTKNKSRYNTLLVMEKLSTIMTNACLIYLFFNDIDLYEI